MTGKDRIQIESEHILEELISLLEDFKNDLCKVPEQDYCPSIRQILLIFGCFDQEIGFTLTGTQATIGFAVHHLFGE